MALREDDNGDSDLYTWHLREYQLSSTTRLVNGFIHIVLNLQSPIIFNTNDFTKSYKPSFLYWHQYIL